MLNFVDNNALLPASTTSAGAVPCWKALATGYESDRFSALTWRCVR
jgi:hypothetical protein